MDIDLKDFYIKIGKRIKFLREKQNFTQEILADKAGISLNYLGKIEIAMNYPGLKTLLKLSKALNITVSELIDI